MLKGCIFFFGEQEFFKLFFFLRIMKEEPADRNADERRIRHNPLHRLEQVETSEEEFYQKF